ncbi:MAG: cation:proton antiporter [Candidatus Thermoplasmatota archaeon]|nr:cation:proton antiporter [Candidatus Thermoplasmatota archaeon]
MMDFIASLLVIFAASAIGRFLSKKSNQPTILGELILGAILGNLAFLHFSEDIDHVADIGILLLLFSAGIAINFEEFKKIEGVSIIVASSGVVLPFILGYFVAVSFGFSNTVALFIGTSLVATSVGVNAEVLMELGKLGTKTGTLIMGAAVVDDIIGIIMLSALISLTKTGVIAIEKILLLIFSAIAFVFISIVWGIRLGKYISKKVVIRKENLLLAGMLFVLLFALIAEKIGLSMIIGSFIAGLIVGQTHFSKEMEEYISLIGGGFFIPIFFVAIGMHFDISAFFSVTLFAIVLLIVAIAGKLFGCGLGTKLCRFSNHQALLVGTAMIPRAGVELVLIKLGIQYGLIDSEIASAILIVVIVTTLISPPLLTKILRSF